jgi:hypothetical protein
MSHCPSAPTTNEPHMTVIAHVSLNCRECRRGLEKVGRHKNWQNGGFAKTEEDLPGPRLASCLCQGLLLCATVPSSKNLQKDASRGLLQQSHFRATCDMTSTREWHFARGPHLRRLPLRHGNGLRSLHCALYPKEGDRLGVTRRRNAGTVFCRLRSQQRLPEALS